MKKIVAIMAVAAAFAVGCSGSNSGYLCEEEVTDDDIVVEDGDDFVEIIVDYDYDGMEGLDNTFAIVENFGFRRSVLSKMEQTSRLDGKQSEENPAETHEVTWSFDGSEDEFWVLIEGPMPDSLLCGSKI